MYTYKALVHCLPYPNKLKLTNVINQSTTATMDLLVVADHDFGIICQANASYVGAMLVKVIDRNNTRELVVSKICVLPNHRRRGYGTAMMDAFKEELKPGERAVIHIDKNDPWWHTQLLEQWGWTLESDDDTTQMYVLTCV